MKMKIKKIDFPQKSVLAKDQKDFDYVDSFAGEVMNSKSDIDISEVGKAFFISGPQWGKKMFAFRNKVVGLFGLKTGADPDKTQAADHFQCEVGERMGIFTVFEKTENEIILGEDDKHLDFRVSLLLDKIQDDKTEKALTISTTVKLHNWLGILYFLPVRPFHRLIVPAMLKNVIGKLEAR